LAGPHRVVQRPGLTPTLRQGPLYSGAPVWGWTAGKETAVPTFTPPTFEERMAGAGRLFSFYTQTMSHAVVMRNGHFQAIRTPSQEETAALVEGVTWFSGGRTYVITNDTGALLEADGFEVTGMAGYGEGGYGTGIYGG